MEAELKWFYINQIDPGYVYNELVELEGAWGMACLSCLRGCRGWRASVGGVLAI